jgi:hypothetical protein
MSTGWGWVGTGAGVAAGGGEGRCQCWIGRRVIIAKKNETYNNGAKLT